MIERLKQTLMMTDIQCQVFLVKTLREAGYEVVIGHDPDKIAADYIFAYPPSREIIPVLLMAHWDTVRTTTGKRADEPVVIFSENGKIENGMGVLGADDRAGIQMILEAQDAYEEQPLLLFTNYEEVGGKGMLNFIKSGVLRPWVDSIYLAVSVDRKGHNQWVCYYRNTDDTLEEFMQRHGYVEEYGTYTDGSDLARTYNLAHVNVSYGGYLPHRADEFVLVDSYLSGVERLTNLIAHVDRKFYRSVGMTNYKTHVVYPNSFDGKGTAALDKIDTNITIMLPPPTCDVCGGEQAVSWNTKAKMFICPKCINRITGKYKEMTYENALLGIEDLKRERQRTRELNVLMKPKSHVNKDYPDCPVCGSNTHVSWSPSNIGFICTQCAYAHDTNPEKHQWDGRFWTRNKPPTGGVITMYVKEDNVYEIAPSGSKIEKIVPAKEHDVVKKCDVCGEYNGNIRECGDGLNMCESCAHGFGDLVDDWEDNQRCHLTNGSEAPSPF